MPDALIIYLYEIKTIKILPVVESWEKHLISIINGFLCFTIVTCLNIIL